MDNMTHCFRMPWLVLAGAFLSLASHASAAYSGYILSGSIPDTEYVSGGTATTSPRAMNSGDAVDLAVQCYSKPTGWTVRNADPANSHFDYVVALNVGTWNQATFNFNITPPGSASSGTITWRLYTTYWNGSEWVLSQYLDSATQEVSATPPPGSLRVRPQYQSGDGTFDKPYRVYVDGSLAGTYGDYGSYEEAVINDLSAGNHTVRVSVHVDSRWESSATATVPIPSGSTYTHNVAFDKCPVSVYYDGSAVNPNNYLMRVDGTYQGYGWNHTVISGDYTSGRDIKIEYDGQELEKSYSWNGSLRFDFFPTTGTLRVRPQYQAGDGTFDMPYRVYLDGSLEGTYGDYGSYEEAVIEDLSQGNHTVKVSVHIDDRWEDSATATIPISAGDAYTHNVAFDKCPISVYYDGSAVDPNNYLIRVDGDQQGYGWDHTVISGDYTTGRDVKIEYDGQESEKTYSWNGSLRFDFFPTAGTLRVRPQYQAGDGTFDKPYRVYLDGSLQGTYGDYGTYEDAVIAGLAAGDHLVRVSVQIGDRWEDSATGTIPITAGGEYIHNVSFDKCQVTVLDSGSPVDPNDYLLRVDGTDQGYGWSHTVISGDNTSDRTLRVSFDGEQQELSYTWNSDMQFTFPRAGTLRVIPAYQGGDGPFDKPFHVDIDGIDHGPFGDYGVAGTADVSDLTEGIHTVSVAVVIGERLETSAPYPIQITTGGMTEHNIVFDRHPLAVFYQGIPVDKMEYAVGVDGNYQGYGWDHTVISPDFPSGRQIVAAVNDVEKTATYTSNTTGRYFYARSDWPVSVDCSTDKPYYQPGETITISAEITANAGNPFLSNVFFRVESLDGTTVIETAADSVMANVGGGKSVQVTWQLPSGTADGPWFLSTVCSLSSSQVDVPDSSFFRVFSTTPPTPTYTITKTDYSGFSVFSLDGGMSAECAVEKALANLACGVSHTWVHGPWHNAPWNQPAWNPAGPDVVHAHPFFTPTAIQATVDYYDQYLGADTTFETVILGTGTLSIPYLSRVLKAPVLPVHFLTGFEDTRELRLLLQADAVHGYKTFTTLGPDGSIPHFGVAWIKLLELPEEYRQFLVRHKVTNVVIAGTLGDKGESAVRKLHQSIFYEFHDVSPEDVYVMTHDSAALLDRLPNILDLPLSPSAPFMDWESGITLEVVDGIRESLKTSTARKLLVLTGTDSLNFWRYAADLVLSFYKKNETQLYAAGTGSIVAGITMNPYIVMHPFYETKIQYVPYPFWQMNLIEDGDGSGINDPGIVNGLRYIEGRILNYFPETDMNQLRYWVNMAWNTGGKGRADAIRDGLPGTIPSANIEPVNFFDLDEWAEWEEADGMASPCEKVALNLDAFSSPADVRQWNATLAPLSFDDITNIVIDGVSYQIIDYSSLDMDGDGIPGWWEYLYFGTDNIAGHGTHGDADGVPDDEEWIADTDPTNPASFFHIGTFEPSSSGFVINWPSSGRRVYEIHHATEFTADSPFALLEGAILGTPPMNCYTDTIHQAETCNFYSIRVRIPE